MKQPCVHCSENFFQGGYSVCSTGGCIHQDDRFSRQLTAAYNPVQRILQYSRKTVCILRHRKKNCSRFAKRFSEASYRSRSILRLQIRIERRNLAHFLKEFNLNLLRCERGYGVQKRGICRLRTQTSRDGQYTHLHEMLEQQRRTHNVTGDSRVCRLSVSIRSVESSDPLPSQGLRVRGSVDELHRVGGLRVDGVSDDFEIDELLVHGGPAFGGEVA